jgi:hypothetical protein
LVPRWSGLCWPTESRRQRYWLGTSGSPEWRIPKGEALPGDDEEVVAAERAEQPDAAEDEDAKAG